MLCFQDSDLRSDEIQPPTRRRQNAIERALRQRTVRMLFRRALWKVSAVLVYAVAIAVIALYVAQLASPWWQAAAH
jgi:hypothetical protein